MVADYHDAQLCELVDRVGDAIDRYRAGERDAFEIDRVLFQYSRAAKDLWKFCNYLQVEVAATMIRVQPLKTGGDAERQESADDRWLRWCEGARIWWLPHPARAPWQFRRAPGGLLASLPDPSGQ